MFRKVSFIIAVGVIFLSACGTPATADIEPHDPWMRPTLQGENAAVYFQLHNHTETVDELIGASSNAAEIVELHESKMVDDVMQMEMLSSVTLDPDTEVNFTPGGLHVMLINVKEEIKLGDHIGVILHFQTHEDIVLDVSVREGEHEEEEHEEGDH
jgi:hypothetical protein